MTPSLKSLEIFSQDCHISIVLRECFTCDWRAYCGPDHRPPNRTTYEDRYTTILSRIRKEKLEKLLS